MKFLIILALALATSSAAVFDKPIFPRDLVVESSPVFDVEGRITNGDAASSGQFKYQSGLSLKSSAGSFWCGGSLIGPNWVLTAAHCTDGVTSATVYLGSTVRSVAKVTHTVSSSAIYQHTGYKSSTLANDISLIQIPSVTYTSEINRIALPAIASSYSTYSGSYAIASGWGRTSDSSSVATYLNYVKLQVIANSVCSSTYGSSVVTANTLCVSTPNSASTCQGDSGGPLALESSGVLIGVTSFVSSAGCTSKAPAGFVRVTSYLSWIKEKTGISY